MPIVSEDVPGSQGPNASVDFGKASQVAAAQREIQSRTGTSTPQPKDVAQNQGPQQAPPDQSSPAQPPTPTPPGRPWNDPGVPRTQDGRLDVDRVFSNLSTVPTWKQNIEMWAAHPNAGPYLKMLADLKRAGEGGNR